ncbi:MAG TPA: tyrosine-type recombinase/integrase [Herpetosiphonaceae bacterium]|nr:tyrosine-type recombinase/integrase [Herpetosiphonaceae bacterium]
MSSVASYTTTTVRPHSALEPWTRLPHTSRKERLVPFSPVPHRALRKYLSLRERFAQADQDASFITPEGRRMSRDALTHVFKRLGRRGGIPRLHPHLLRHSVAVAAIMNGAGQFAPKRILSYPNPNTTDHYVDFAQQHLAEWHRQFSPMARVNERKAQAQKQGKRRA